MAQTKEIYLAGGCFWGTEEYFKCIKGVTKTSVGYANGAIDSPTYEQVKHTDTGFAETVFVQYDAAIASLGFLLDMYFKVIDPTSVDKQGEDVGHQYRTGIYYTDPADLNIINASISDLQTHYDTPVTIEIMPLKNYYLAEEYHQDYLEKNPGGYCHIGKKMFDMAKNASDSTKHDNLEK